eukprot:CAMPEP_0185804044 /NCGR_PEP_ID=MMETSP1322-20130828/3029_1 /TAXON_ID=265543 /ORGANISM="Minutocellus polymorphus, Strain RCC2270" /LENGTH=653 /DNA_ID=CAMNT_0028500001 /DNA_START=94 /DNA_END=2055 /DNA_ORIENTATION=-
MSDYEARNAALVEFVGIFEDVSSAPTTLSDLSDGVALFEALSEIAPDYFDPTTVTRDLGDNWALKSSNLRKLLRNLEVYYHSELDKTSDLFSSLDVSAIAKEADVHGIVSLVELVAAAAVQCEKRGEIVPRIMTMSASGQVEMKAVIEDSMGQLQDRQGGDDDGGNDEEDIGSGPGGGEIEFDSDDYNSDDDGDPSKSMSAMFTAAEHDIDAAMADLDGGEAAAISGSPRGSGSAALAKERDELNSLLEEAQRELASQKSQAAILAEEHESAERKLRALAEDLQERLGRRQEDLSAAEEKLVKTKRGRDDAESKVTDLTEKCATLADELDVASAKAAQLAKAEATVVAYRKRLEAAGSMTQQMTEMENQAEGYLRQIMELETDVKKLPGLQNTVDELQTKVGKLEKERVTAEDDLRAKATEVTKLKGEVSSTESARKMFEEELTALKAQQESAADTSMDDLANDVSSMSMSGAHAKSLAEAKEKAMRMDVANQKLQEQMEEMKRKHEAELEKAAAAAESAAAAASAAATSEAAAAAKQQGQPAVSSLEMARLQGQIAQLEKDLKQKEAEKAKLGSDKEKLEAYTKKTLSKFQEKYLVALQECKAKLKEKHDKIEALEMRSASEKTAQKREERLLSSTIYELGLAIMQQRLKDR